MTLPYSDAIFACTFPRECTEAFLEGHVRAFAFFGGVPRRISYDNSKIAVARITGTRDRKLTDEFLRLKSHHLFEEHFCLVRRPNEKGHVETLVGFARRNFLVPVPAAHGGLEPLNARLEADCRADLARRLRGKPATKAELLAEERAAMLPLPAEAFLAARVEQPTADSLSLVRFDTNDYSVPTAYAHHKLTAVGTVDTRPDRGRGPRGGRAPAVLGPRAGLLRPGPLPGPAGAQARGAGLRGPAGGLGAAGLLRRAPPPARGRVRRAGDAAVHQGPAAPGVGQPAGPDPGGGAGLGAGRGRRRRGAADPGAPAARSRWACSASTAGRT